ncbi:MAG TPA: hypothetical protein PLR06_04050 [Cyclobacteriaceae bacterium]|nr:hypothetical protein [Cyclobacteriaceae bacterium]
MPRNHLVTTNELPDFLINSTTRREGPSYNFFKQIFMRSVLWLAVVVMAGISNSWAQATDLVLIKASHHPMQYYLSVPKGWNASRKWPVVVVLEAAEKDFKANAERFISTRGDLPFIIVAPINTNNGNAGRRDASLFPYSNETWDYMDKVGDCQFNDEGLVNIIADVAAHNNGESKVYLTGFEAGTHVLWSMVFNHPEVLMAAMPVAGNWRNRCFVEEHITTDPAKKEFPIHSIVGELDEYFGPKGGNYVQWTAVRDLASSHGYQNISEVVIPKKGHAPMPEEVWKYLMALIGKK